MSGRPKPRSADQINEAARKLSDLPQIERIAKFANITDLLAESRASLETNSDEILKLAGYKDITQYWDVALSRQIPVSRYALILAIQHERSHDPHGNVDLKRYSLTAYNEIHDALRAAWAQNMDWIILRAPNLDFYEDWQAKDYNEEGWRGIFLLPREATEWLLANGSAELVPASLREYMANIEDHLKDTPPPPTPLRTQRTKKPSEEEIAKIKSLFKGYIVDMKRDDAIQKITKELNISREAVRAQQVKSTRGRGVKIVRDKLNS